MHTKIAGIRKQWTACQLQGLNLLKGSSMKETLSKNAIFALHKSIKVIICKNSQMTAHSSYGCRDFTRLFLYSCSNTTTTFIQISRLFYFGYFSKTNHQMMIWLAPIVSKSKSNWYTAQKVQKYALNSQLQALQILKNDDEVENWSLSSFLLKMERPYFYCRACKDDKTYIFKFDFFLRKCI